MSLIISGLQCPVKRESWTRSCKVPSSSVILPFNGENDYGKLSLPKVKSFFFLIYLFIYFWLCWVLVSVRGLSLVAASRGHSSSRCAGLSLSQPLLLWSTGSRDRGSVVVAHGLSCSAACGIFPDQGSNPCPLHWQADSQPLRHQGGPPKVKSYTRELYVHLQSFLNDM